MHSARQIMVLAATLWCSTAVLGVAQDQQPKKIEKAPVKSTAANSGADMFKSYGAACHGAGGKGDGPAASALKIAPPDLTMLSKRNNGQFPQSHVDAVLKGGPGAAAHGSPEMPVWGPLFSAVSASNEGVVNLRISNLEKYLQAMQAK